MAYLDSIKSNLEKRQYSLDGCSEQEIKQIESEGKVTLPACYIEFLQLMGKNMDEDENRQNLYDYGSFVGLDCFYNDILTNNEGAKELLIEDAFPLELPEKAFVFLMGQGYWFTFFKTDEGNNPPVYYYMQGSEQKNFPKITNSLSDFYEQFLEGKKGLFPF